MKTRKWSELSPTGNRVDHEETLPEDAGTVTLDIGDVIKISQSMRLVIRAGESGVRHVSINGQIKSVTFRKGFDDEKTVQKTSWGDAETCCSTLPREMIVARLGHDEVKKFQAAKHDGTVAAWIERNTGSVTTENNEQMKTTSKLPRRGGLAASVLADKAAAAAGETKPKKTGKKASVKKPAADGDRVTGKLFDNSIGAVLRALGKAGVTEEQAAKILKEKGFTSSPITIKVNIRSGNGTGHNYGAPAELTKAQLDELKSLIEVKPYYQDAEVTIFNADAREVLPHLGRFDLLLTDPAYGIGADANAHKNGVKCRANGFREYLNTTWDASRTPSELIEMAMGCADESIIWGGNYFTDILSPSMGWIIWDKCQRNFSFADAELAWTSYQRAMRVASISRANAMTDGKQHPTQKSLELMSFCLAYAERAGCKPIKTVLDPFGGSGTTARACKDRGIKCVLVEQVEAYAEIAASRMHQENLFASAPAPVVQVVEPPRLLFDLPPGSK